MAEMRQNLFSESYWSPLCPEVFSVGFDLFCEGQKMKTSLPNAVGCRRSLPKMIDGLEEKLARCRQSMEEVDLKLRREKLSPEGRKSLERERNLLMTKADNYEKELSVLRKENRKNAALAVAMALLIALIYACWTIVMHFDTFPPFPEEAAVMADTVGREESKISLAGKGKENTAIPATDSCPCYGSHTETLRRGALEKTACSAIHHMKKGIRILESAALRQPLIAKSMIPHQQFPESLRRCQLLQHTLLVTSCACTANDCKDKAPLSSLLNTQAYTHTPHRPVQTLSSGSYSLKGCNGFRKEVVRRYIAHEQSPQREEYLVAAQFSNPALSSGLTGDHPSTQRPNSNTAFLSAQSPPALLSLSGNKSRAVWQYQQRDDKIHIHVRIAQLVESDVHCEEKFYYRQFTFICSCLNCGF
ncbi:hypothetical protein IHE44_0009093 [Lamprotornis superbus]|uniref:Coiled-coil domain-containing protein 167 n=1 Tax=Lamprotornis superbus TaxID=245042 RepID=A0A835NVX1_9PASS|nr:hypothetical protein IHE44_0009093 [Lamprotornis superbus]